jgi:hypothetical protein
MGVEQYLAGFTAKRIVDGTQHSQVPMLLQVENVPRKSLDLIVIEVEGCMQRRWSSHAEIVDREAGDSLPTRFAMPDIPSGRLRSWLQSTRRSSSLVKFMIGSGSRSSLLCSRNRRCRPASRLTRPSGTDDSWLWLHRETVKGMLAIYA